MRKLDFWRFDLEEEKEEFLFSLTLNNGKVTASNSEGKEYLSNLLELYDFGANLREAELFAEGKYEEFFDFLERACKNPDFYTA